MKPLINIDEVELEPRPAAFAPTGEAAERFDARLGTIGSRIGAQQFGCNITAVPPGKRAFPFHNHHANEELFFILEGDGELRLGDATYPVRKGDVIACPAGDRETAHQLINTGESELRYLAISTMHGTEVCQYPDSDKFAISAVLPGDGKGTRRMFRFVGRIPDQADYWEGE